MDLVALFNYIVYDIHLKSCFTLQYFFGKPVESTEQIISRGPSVVSFTVESNYFSHFYSTVSSKQQKEPLIYLYDIKGNTT